MEIKKTITVSLDEFSETQIITYVEENLKKFVFEDTNSIEDYVFQNRSMGGFSDEQLSDELESRGFHISHENDIDSLNALYVDYMTVPFDFFKKKLNKYFEDNLDVMI